MTKFLATQAVAYSQHKAAAARSFSDGNNFHNTFHGLIILYFMIFFLLLLLYYALYCQKYLARVVISSLANL